MAWNVLTVIFLPLLPNGWASPSLSPHRLVSFIMFLHVTETEVTLAKRSTINPTVSKKKEQGQQRRESLGVLRTQQKPPVLVGPAWALVASHPLLWFG